MSEDFGPTFLTVTDEELEAVYDLFMESLFDGEE